MSIDQDLEDDLRWREDELAALKQLASSAPNGSTRQRALLRALVAMLYAHYEGFSKFCWESYIDAIRSSGPKLNKLKKPIKEAALSNDIQRLRKTATNTEFVSFLEKYRTHCGKTRFVTVAVDTKSNLWPDQFLSINNSLDLKCQYIVSKRPQIGALVGRRNGIAHGEKLVTSDYAGYEELEHATVLVMHELALAVSNAVKNSEFVK